MAQRAIPRRGSWAAAKERRGQRHGPPAQGTTAFLELLREADVQATMSQFRQIATAFGPRRETSLQPLAAYNS